MPQHIVFLLAPGALAMPSSTHETPARTEEAVVTIPTTVQREHKKIHDALMAATKTPGPVGTEARELATVLGPHFEREEQIALAPLAAGEQPAGMKDVLAMSDALLMIKEMPCMLEEHQRI